VLSLLTLLLLLVVVTLRSRDDVTSEKDEDCMSRVAIDLLLLSTSDTCPLLYRWRT
jgi:hypothetical protein